MLVFRRSRIPHYFALIAFAIREVYDLELVKHVHGSDRPVEDIATKPAEGGMGQKSASIRSRANCGLLLPEYGICTVESLVCASEVSLGDRSLCRRASRARLDSY